MLELRRPRPGRAEVERLLIREDISLRERTLWRMLHELLAQPSRPQPSRRHHAAGAVRVWPEPDRHPRPAARLLPDQTRNLSARLSKQQSPGPEFAIRIWIDRRTGELPAGFGRDVRAWLVMLLDGDARTRPRSPATLRVHLGIVQPFIECWAAERGQLREITSGDVDTVLEPLRGHRRYNAIMAVRSLFRFAKRRGLTFADPTRHLSGGRGAGRAVLPMTAEQIRAAGQAAVTPAQRLAIALAAVHAARPRPSANSPSTTSTCPPAHHPRRHRQPLGELTRNALLAWLGYRRATWPDTANRHVLLSRISALGTGPVSPDYLDKHQLRGISLEQIRRDRILQEALATGGDPSTLPWSSTSITPTRWPTPTPPATFSAAVPTALSCRPE